MPPKTYTEEEVRRISDVAAMGVDIAYIKKTIDGMNSQLTTFAIKADLYQFRNDASAVNTALENRMRIIEDKENQWLGIKNFITWGIALAAGLAGAFIERGHF